ncbi:MAG: queuosine precursor transporter [Candidatus Levybacteria bacterium]|nr:queuosine precursor transporter [Candidatus Levybacteria bacterium]
MPLKRLSNPYHYLDVITAFFVAVLLISNIASTKITALGPLTLDAGTILFPLAYILGDMVTEVYGYARARRVIWIGFFCNILAAAIFMIVGVLPTSADWPNQQAYDIILGVIPRIVLASMVAYFVGSFLNAFILAKVKVITKGKRLWIRTIGSTMIGQFFDTVLFILIAFAGVLPNEVIIALIVSNYIFKVLLEIVLTPLIYILVAKMKKAEHEDYYDKKTDFNPFAVTTKKI